jgi:hypothetical protein
MFYDIHLAPKNYVIYNSTLSSSNSQASLYLGSQKISKNLSLPSISPHSRPSQCTLIIPASRLHFHCYVTYKQHPNLCHIKFDCRIPTLPPLPCYTFCTQKFQAIQFDRWGLTSSGEPLSPYFGSSGWRVHEISNS